MDSTTPEHSESQPSHAGAGLLRRGLDTLRVKLFLFIAGTHLALVAAVYVLYSFSFEKSLSDYVVDSEKERLSPVITAMADGYRKYGNWNWLTDSRNWLRELQIEALEARGDRTAQPRTGAPSPPPGKALASDTTRVNVPPAGGSAGEARVEGKGDRRVENTGENKGENKTEARGDRGRPDLPNAPRGDRGGWIYQNDALTIEFWRLMLFDASGNVLINSQFDTKADAARATKLPVHVDNQIVGYLGYVPRLQRVESLESITRQKQANSIKAIGLGMFVAVLIIAWLIAYWLARRLGVLGQGATALARGDYATRIPVQGHDELARLAGDFNHLAQALEAAQRGRQQWIADIAHELRTPLTALRAEIEAVQDGVRPLTQASIASVAHEVQRLTRLVEDLRLLTLSDLGALTYRKQPVDLGEALADALAVGRATIEQKGLEVQQRIDGSVIVDADEDRLAQVFGNLLQNTLRYTTAPGTLRVSLGIEGREARIDWEDSAPGVGDTDLPRLTERLYRVDASRSSSSGGSGLGLAIVQAIVQAHGGRMQATHGSMGGLRWRIWLPLSDHARA